MIKLQGKLPRNLVLACSGGVDSMAALDFLRRNHKVTVAHVNHRTEHGIKTAAWLREQCRTKFKDVRYREFVIEGTCPKGVSKEEWWRNERYNWLNSTFYGQTVVTVHHLDDCVETWVWSSMHGQGKIIPYRNEHVIRPFRLTRKRDLELWANLNNIEYKEDDSNKDLCYTRNYIRHEMLPHVLRVNPGIHKVIAKKIKDNLGKDSHDKQESNT
jgi:tRNA(Ile)-lysidine synthase